MPAKAVAAIRALAVAAIGLLDRKAAVPLEPIAPDAGFTAARAAYDGAAAAIEAANAVIRAANTIITDKKAATDAGDLKTTEAELARLNAIQTRHRADVSDLCAAYTKRRSILSDSVAICVTRSRCGMAASTGSQSPEPNHSTWPRLVMAARRAMSSGKRS